MIPATDVRLAGLAAMMRIRLFEDRVRREFGKGDMPGFVHTYVGAEAVAVSACAHLRRDDIITSTHRGHGHCLAKGVKIAPMIAELFGRETGICHGRGGSMHIADFSCGVLGANAIVGGGIALAVGAAQAAQTLGDGARGGAFFGDGAANEGVLHESMNLASIWRLPAVFVCENNGWAESTPTMYALSVPHVADRAAGYLMPGVTIDASDYDGLHAVRATPLHALGGVTGRRLSKRPSSDTPATSSATPRATAVATIEGSTTPRCDRGASTAVGPSTACPPTRWWPTHRRPWWPSSTMPSLPLALRRGRRQRKWSGMSTQTESIAEMTFLEAIRSTLAVAMRLDPRCRGDGRRHRRRRRAGTTAGRVDGRHVRSHEGPHRGVRPTPSPRHADLRGSSVGAAVGAAMAGLRPVVDLMWASFTPYCFDQIANQAAKLRYMSGGQATIPLVIRMAAGAGLRAAAQHSDTLYPIFSHIPGLKVVVPATPAEAQGLLLSSIADDGPVIFIEHMDLYVRRGPVPTVPVPMPLGVLGIERPGSDITVACVGQAVHPAAAAINELGTGVGVELISLRTLQPLDLAGLVDSVRTTLRLVVVEESPPRCSVSADVAANVGQALFGKMLAPIAARELARIPRAVQPNAGRCAPPERCAHTRRDRGHVVVSVTSASRR